ncbi:unnamed protein product [Ectocarpus sp. CCAP 1310/34]|nr:unnamed protein product [Ectocarpus sp. CCAP 1310/34]
MLNPFVNVLQTSRTDGAKLSRPLLSNWSFPVRSVADGRRLKVCEATKEYMHSMDLWLFEHGPLENMPLLHYHSLCRHMMSKVEQRVSVQFMSDGVKALEDGGAGARGGKNPTGRHWHLAKVGYGASRTADAFLESVGPEMDIGVYVTVHVEDILVDEGNESLLLDVTLCLWDSQLPADFFVAESGPSALATALARGCEIVVPFLDQLLPMAVERGRRTYCHRPDCRYLATANSGGAGWSGRGGDGKGKDDPPLCLCAAGKDISPSLVKGLRDSGRAEVLPRLYHAVLPTLIAVDDVEGFRLKSNALVDDEGGGRGGFAHLKKPVGKSSGAMLSYNGPIRGVGNIVESVPVAAVQERGGGVANQPLGSVSPSAANALGGVEGNDSAYANGKPSSTAVSSAKTDSLVGVDEETRRVLAKAGLGRMPATTFEWVKFERVQQGLPADTPCPVCQELNGLMRCSRCKIVKYCSRECQKQHWHTHHKLECYADS